MIVKEKLDEEYVTVAEVKEVLNEIAEERAEQDREMAYELRQSLDHANEFAVLEADEARELLDELNELEQVDDFVAHKVADLLPNTRDELRAIYAKERYSLDTDEIDEILNVVAKYR
ncbi:MAG: RNA polymerase Rpb4 family protein [Halobacteriales archaeon]|nr:RNA polymerase Rpb4 family protein [Halobacteriales archaeon]